MWSDSQLFQCGGTEYGLECTTNPVLVCKVNHKVLALELVCLAFKNTAEVFILNGISHTSSRVS